MRHTDPYAWPDIVDARQQSRRADSWPRHKARARNRRTRQARRNRLTERTTR